MITIHPNGDGLTDITDPRVEVVFAPDVPAHVRAEAERRIERARHSFAWAQARADMAARNLAENLRTGFAGKVMWDVVDMECAVNVVGAGPSMRLANLGLSSRPTLLAGSVAAAVSGLDASVLPLFRAVIAECLPIPYLDAVQMPIVCSITADPAVFSRATAVYVRADSAYSRIAHELRTKQIADGVNVATTMLALCESNRTQDVQMFGVDLCAAPTGEVYARGTPWASMRATEDGGNVAFTDIPDAHPGMSATPAIAAKNCRGQDVLTTPEWLEAKAWIEMLAQRSRMRIANRSGGLPMDLSPVRPVARVAEPAWPEWTDDAFDDLRLCREFEAAYPEVGLFTAAARTRIPLDLGPTELLTTMCSTFRDGVERMKKGWRLCE